MAAKNHDVRILLTDHGRGKVIVDGKEMSVVGFTVEGWVDGANTVHLTLLADRLEVQGPFHVFEHVSPQAVIREGGSKT